ncbi:hypothetical protein [Shewanella sp. MBTL60-007]|nr:hypothetical protein [Shewanella sp. MBTL60-007]
MKKPKEPDYHIVVHHRHYHEISISSVGIGRYSSAAFILFSLIETALQMF